MLCLLRRRRSVDLPMKRTARIHVDSLDVEWVALVELGTVGDRREHVWTVVTAERDSARIVATRCIWLLKQRTQLAPNSLLRRGVAASEHCLHDPDQHPLVIVQRPRVVRRLLDHARKRESTPLAGPPKSKRSSIVAMSRQKPRNIVASDSAIAERIVGWQRQEILGGCHSDKVSNAV
jgi:hypothetical protein